MTRLLPPRTGNRNAASHLWSTFILERSRQLSHKTFTKLFGGFCAVSGSPVQPTDYNKYRLNLAQLGGGRRTGFMHYCCWPCVCDTQDFIKVDTLSVKTKDGVRQYHFAVIGNPCDQPGALTKPFYQPFDKRQTTIAHEAQEVRCVALHRRVALSC